MTGRRGDGVTERKETRRGNKERSISLPPYVLFISWSPLLSLALSHRRPVAPSPRRFHVECDHAADLNLFALKFCGLEFPGASRQDGLAVQVGTPVNDMREDHIAGA